MADTFTPEQISQILEAFFETVGTRQYIGARYVPIFGRKNETSITWDNSAPYEPLTVVLYQGNSFTSRQYVPTGVDIDNTKFWAETGNFNAQIEQYRREVAAFNARITANETGIDAINAALPNTTFSGSNTVKSYIDTNDNQIKSLLPAASFADKTVKEYIDEQDTELSNNVAADYVPFPTGDNPKYGTAAQVLSTLANGKTMWVNPVVPSDAQAQQVITDWLNAHPEATTTVQDGAISNAKLSQAKSALLYQALKCNYFCYGRGNSITDLNDAPDNSIGWFQLGANPLPENTPDNMPITTGLPTIALLYTINPAGATGLAMQIYKSCYDNREYYRVCVQSTWGAWAKRTIDDDSASAVKTFSSSKITQLIGNPIRNAGAVWGPSSLPDLNDAQTNAVYTFNMGASTTELPLNYPTETVMTGFCILVTIEVITNANTQYFYSLNNQKLYTRYKAGGNWTDWVLVRGANSGHNTYTCLKDGTGDYNNLVRAIEEVSQEMDATLYVGAGTWDICAEFGSEYMESVTNTTGRRGIELKNRIHIIGASNSKIVANYSGTRNETKEYFSAFNAGEYGFTLENLNIETSNIRYSVHDDRGAGGGEGYINRYINCSMKHTNGTYTDCIGGGLGTNGLIEILNCYFEGNPDAARLVYYHGNNYGGQTDAQCKIICSGNYFAGVGTFGLTKYGDSTKVSTAYASNNSTGSAMFVNSGSYAPNDNMQLISWNNELRS